MNKRSVFLYAAFAIATAVVMLLVLCRPQPVYTPIPKDDVVYVENRTNTLHVLLFCHSSDYFLYRGTTVGFQYELLNILGDSLQKDIQFTFTTDPEEVRSHFFTSDFDIIAFDVDPNQSNRDKLCLSEPHSTFHPVLLQHRKALPDTADVIHVPSHFPCIINNDSLPVVNGKWQFCSDTLLAEELVELLQDDSIHYLVTDCNTAIMLNPFYSDLQIVKSIGPEVERRWVLNPANISKNDSINNWLLSFRQTEKYAKLCNKYFHPHSRYILGGGREKRKRSISSYDAVMKRYGTKYGVDWRFVSSIIRQESGFKTDLVGMGGSFGVMQMMPATAANFGVSDTSSVEQQICAGVRLLARLDHMFAKYVEDADERLYYVAAAYNAGSGHVVDACELCIKYGGDVTSWKEVSQYLLLKKEHKYYSDPVVKCGYYPGRHTVNYVEDVMNRYHGYRMSLPAGK